MKRIFHIFCFLLLSLSVCYADIESDVYSMRLDLDEIELLIKRIEENGGQELHELNTIRQYVVSLRSQIDAFLTSEVFTNISHQILLEIASLRNSIFSVAISSFPSNLFDEVWDVNIHHYDQSVLLDFKGMLQDVEFQLAQPLAVDLNLSSNLINFSYFDDWRKQYLFSDYVFSENNYFDLEYYTIDETQPKLFYIDNFDPANTIQKSSHNAWRYGKSFPEMFRAFSDKTDRQFNVLNNNLLHIFAALTRSNDAEFAAIKSTSDSLPDVSLQLSNAIASVSTPSFNVLGAKYTQLNTSLTDTLSILPRVSSCPSQLSFQFQDLQGNTQFLQCDIHPSIQNFLSAVRVVSFILQITLLILFVFYNVRFFCLGVNFVRSVFSHMCGPGGTFLHTSDGHIV